MMTQQSFWRERNQHLARQKGADDSLCRKQMKAKQQHRKQWKSLPEFQEESVEHQLEQLVKSEIVAGSKMQGDEENTPKESLNRMAEQNPAIREMISLFECAEALKQRVSISCIDKGLYVFNKKYYEKIDGDQLMTIYRDKVDRTLHNAKSLNTFRNLYKFLQTDTEIQKTIDYAAVDDLAVLENGVFNVRNQKLVPHSEKYMFMYQINASYTEENETPIFDKFLVSVTGGNAVLIKRLWYLIAYLCMHSVSAKCFFVLGTAPNSGKSVFGRFIQKLFEARFISSIALTDMNKDFSLAPIVGKAVNVSMDLPSSKVSAAASSKLKMLTGDDLVTINEKYVPQFCYYNRAKFLFASNHPIKLVEEDEAFWNRLVYFPFNHSIPKEAQDVKLLDKILEEKDVIVSRALRYGKSFIKNNYTFPSTPEIEETLAIWKGERNYSVENFLRDCCDIKESYAGEWTSVLYAAYEEYCEKCEKDCVSSEVFKQILKSQQGVKPKKFRKNGSWENPRAGFTGIKLMSDTYSYDSFQVTDN